MKNPKVVIAVLAALIVVSGALIYKTVTKTPPPAPAPSEVQEEIVPADSAITLGVTKVRAKDNTLDIQVAGLGGKYTSLSYELTYESEGLIKGVNSGSKPIDVAGQDTFSREVYLGTCSRNVCKPDAGVKKVSVVIEFTDTAGARSQLSKEFDL